MKLTENTITKILSGCETALKKGKLMEDEISDYLGKVRGVLYDYRDYLGEETEIIYRIRKRVDRLELRMAIKGQKLDPFEKGRDLERRRHQKVISNFVFNQEVSMVHVYSMGYNVVSIRSPKLGVSKNILKQPMVLAVVFGVLAGLLCQLLPENAMSFIVEDVASLLLKVVINLVAGIMGPFAFLSILTAVSNLDSVSSLNTMGSKVVKRFLLIALYTTLVYMVVAMIFFPNFGTGSANESYDSGKIVDMILSIVPTSLFLPFVNNNLPQMLILGIGIGTIILILGDRASGVSDIISQLHSIVGELMSLVIKLMPAVPFLSIMQLTAKGEFSTILMGWKYIVASLICIILCHGIKILKVKMKYKVDFSLLWKKMRPAFMIALATGSSTAALRKVYDISEHQFGIKPLFSSFWLPLSWGMLSPSYTVGYVLAPFMVAEMTGMSVSIHFILVLGIITYQLSLSGVGLEAALAIIFHCLGMPLEYVGLFAAYNVFLKNLQACSVILYRMLEQTEVAVATDNIDMSYIKPVEAS